jgi:hypothetical protein
LNLNDAKKQTGPQHTAEEGVQVAVITQVVGLGLQDGGFWQGEKKPDQKMVRFTYELVNDVHDFGGEMKPLVISEEFAFSGNEKSRCYKRANGIDPGLKNSKGDLSKFVGKPVMVQIIHNAGKGKHEGKVFANIGGVTPLPKGMPAPQTTFNPQFFYDPYKHNEEVFQQLPDFLKEKIQNRLDAGAVSRAVKETADDTTEEFTPASAPTTGDDDW